MLKQRGATLVEAAVVVPLLLTLVLLGMQVALVFHARSTVTYATFQAARAGSVAHADVGAMQAAFRKAMLAYYGGGRNAAELAQTALNAAMDLQAHSVRLEILSPTAQSFDDYNSVQLQEKYKTAQRVIPQSGLDELRCPRERPSCPWDPRSNSSGQTLQDANLLQLRITYGIPRAKQLPIAGLLFTRGAALFGLAGSDAFVAGLLAQGRIPLVAQTVIRMQSDAIANGAVQQRAATPAAGGK
jgi:hypothetical protein